MNARYQSHRAPRHAALLALLAVASSLPAQQVVAPPPPVAVAPPGYQQVTANGVQQITPSKEEPAEPKEAPLLQQGILSVRPRMSYRLVSGDGIQSTLGHPVTTTIQSLSPGVLLGLGEHWTLDYAPTWTFYSNRTFRDTVDHAASLAAGYSSGESTIGFSQTYTLASPTLVETGQQTRQESYATGINGSHRLGHYTLMDLAASQSVMHADAFTSSRSSTVSGMLHYQFSERLDMAGGLSVAFVDVNVGPDMTTTRPQAQIGWRPTDKVSLDIHGGVENRGFRSGGMSNMSNPVYGASVRYRPVESTTLALDANRGVSTSLFANEITKSTGWGANLQQRLLEEFSLSFGYTEAKTDYLATETTVTAGRDDKDYSFNVRLSTTFLRRGSIGVFYQKGHNSSNTLGYGFSTNQYGLEIGYRF